MTSRVLTRLWCLVSVVMLATSGYRCALADWPRSDAKGVEITLWPTCTAIDDVVLISHIARVSGGSESQRERIESLDLVDAPRAGETTEVPSKLVEFRLRLAGVDPRYVSIYGSKSEVKGFLTAARSAIQPSVSASQNSAIRTAVHTPKEPVNGLERSFADRPFAKSLSEAGPAAGDKTIEDMIVNAARRAILSVLPWGEDNVSIQLAQPVGREAQFADTPAGCRCSTRIRSSGPPVGRVNVDVTVTASGQSPLVVPVAFEVRHYENVVATARPVARGRAIEQDDLYLHRWDVTGATDYCTKPEQLIGRVANRAMPALQLVREQDLTRGSADATGPDRPVVIKRQARVKMTAKIGDLNITVNGEAMQEGRIGESIKVQNVESKAIVSGKVLSADEVEISY